MNFWNFFTIYVFEVREFISDIPTEQPCSGDLENPSHFRYRGTWRCWWLRFMNFWNFFTIHVFEVGEFNSDIPTELPCLGDLKNPSQLPVQGTWRYWWLSHINFWNFFSIYVFEVGEIISDIPTELPCLGDLENPGQLPVQVVLEGTDDFVLWVFTISSVFMFPRSMNLWVTFLLSYPDRVTSKI